jgi:hypothetical protein
MRTRNFVEGQDSKAILSSMPPRRRTVTSRIDHQTFVSSYSVPLTNLIYLALFVGSSRLPVFKHGLWVVLTGKWRRRLSLASLSRRLTTVFYELEIRVSAVSETVMTLQASFRSSVTADGRIRLLQGATEQR